MHKFFLIILLFIAGCSSQKTDHDTFPGNKYLDSIADKNSDLLYYWTGETFKNEKSIPNNHDLDIKINRKVVFSFLGKKYILYPFFKKPVSNHKVLFLHFLLTHGNLKADKLTHASFKDLTILNAEKAYYSYQVN